MLKKFVLGSIAAVVLAACGGEGSNSASSTPAQSGSASGSLIERINNKGTITVGTEGTYAPFTYHDKDGKLTGYDVEVTRAVADKLGVKVEFKETQWDSMMAGLKAGRFDVVANQVGLTSPERQATFDKSEPYSWSGAVLVARKDSNIKSIDDIKGVKTAQSLTSNYGEKAKAAGAELVPVDGLAQSLTLIEQKRADATLNDELAVLDYLKKNPNAGVQIVWSAPADEKVGSGLIVNKGNDEALAKFSTAMTELKADGTLKNWANNSSEKTSVLNNFLASLPFMTETRADMLISAFWPMVKAGFAVSLPLAIASFVIGMIIAVAVALVRIMPSGGIFQKCLLKLVEFYISVIRGTPLLVQLVIVFYGLPSVGIYIDPIPAAIIGFSLNVGAYASETIRAAILSVPKGQWEAGFSIGMTYMQTFRRIVAPQAFRVAVPPLSNEFIGLFKNTSLAAVVTVTELFRVAQETANRTYDFLPVYIEAALVYWCFCKVLFLIQARLEKRFDRYVAK